MDNNKEKLSFYYLLGVPEDATTSEIKQAYFNWMQKLAAYVKGLPEDDKKRKNAIGIVQILNEIYQILVDADLRQQYDAARAQGRDTLFRVGNSVCYNNGVPFDLSDFIENKNNEEEENKADTNCTTIVHVPQEPKRTAKPESCSSIVHVPQEPKRTDRPESCSSIILAEPSNLDSDYIPVVHIDRSDEAENTAKKGRNVVRAIALTTAIALIIGTIGYWIGRSRNESSQKGEGIVPSTSTSDSSTPGTSSSTTSEPEVIDPIVNYGDATNPQVVNAKVDELSELVNKLEIVNPQTKMPYDKEDLKNIVLFMNGAFIPEKDEQAYALVDQQLDLICEILSTQRVINYVNHMAGSTSITEDMIKEDIENGTDLKLVDSMLLGDSYGYEYLHYLENSYNELLKTTDKEKFVKKYTEVVTSLARLVYGQPLVMNKKEYTISDFCGLGNINDGNILNMYANMLSVLNVDGVSQSITIKGRDGSNVTVSLEELFSNFDLVCVTDTLDIDNDGKVVGITDNFHQRVQVDTLNAAIENRYHGNLNAYDYNYNKALN